jgi:hypothetical protein
MSKMLKVLFISFILLFSFWVNTFAKVASFKVIVTPAETQVWKAVDVTIKAMDENGNVDKNYNWTIILLEWENTTEWEVEYPWFADSTYPSYTFTSADEWVKKFENAIKFLKSWNKAIAVAAEEGIDDEWPTWESSVKVWWWTSVAKWDISLTSPTNDETLSKNTVKVTGQTKKNHKVRIKLNDNKVFNTIADSSWFFEYEINNVPDTTNIIQAFVLDWDENEMWASNEVSFTVVTTLPALSSFTIDPEENIKALQNINVEVRTEPDMDVNITINDAVYNLEEDMEWKYIWTFPAPDENWDFPIDLEISDDLWNKNSQNAIKTITIKKDWTPPKKDEIKPEEKTSTWTIKEAEETPAVVQTWACEDIKISWLKLTTLKTKSVLSWDKVNGAIGYKVYKKEKEKFNLIENIDTNRYTVFIKEAKEITYADFAVKAICKKDWQEIESKEYSEITKIQTGPREMILFMLFAMLISGLYFIFSRKKS